MLLEAVVVSVDGLLDVHEVAVRAGVEALREEAARVAVALAEAELGLEHVLITRATLAAVLAGPGAASAQDAENPAPHAEVPACGCGGAGERSVVPRRRPDMTEDHLPADYRRVVAAICDAPGPVRVKALAVRLGLELVPAKTEGLRSKLKRLVARGWLAETAPGVFGVLSVAPTGPGGGSS